MIFLKLSIFSSLPVASMTIGRNAVEQLTLAESVTFLAADLCDGIVEIVEHDVLLRRALGFGVGAVRLAYRPRHGAADRVEKGIKVRLLAVRGDRHVRRRDVQPDAEVGILRRFRHGVESPQPNRLISRLSRAARMLPVTGVRLTQARSRVLALAVVAHASTTKGISARGPLPNDAIPLDVP